MRLLLDTHIWIWRLLEPERISTGAEEVLSDPENELHLSPISVWETLVLARKGRLKLEPDPGSWVRSALRATQSRMLPLTHEIAIRSEQLSGFSSLDPADRLLVASALVSGMKMVTTDRKMREFEPLDVVW